MMTCYGGSGARISTSCTRTKWAMVCFSSIFFSLFLQAPSVSHMVFFCLLSFLSPPLSINTNNRSTRGPLFSSFFRRYHPSSSFCAPPFPPSLSPFPYVLSSHIRIVISPVVAAGAHATAVLHPAGSCSGRVISGRKICNGVRDCRGSNEIQ